MGTGVQEERDRLRGLRAEADLREMARRTRLPSPTIAVSLTIPRAAWSQILDRASVEKCEGHELAEEWLLERLEQEAHR